MLEETGVGIRNPLWFIGVIENNVDERLEGRVQVRAFGIHGTVQQVPTADLPWATLISGSYDPNIWIPPLNAWVFGFFIDGRDAQQPMIIGLIPTQMTEPVNPDVTGWGVIPGKNFDTLGQGSRPTDFGQPANSRLSRGEYLEETYIPFQEANRVRGVDMGATANTQWEEPSAAYNAQYPFNKVTETPGGHSIELDDTPGAERIMVWHKSGSFVQIDSRGTSTYKSSSDKYDITQINHHVYIGGRSMVTVMGDAYVRVNGNKIEEIGGDFRQLVQGNYELSVAGQLNLNGSDDVQIRAAKIRMESNVEDISLKAGKKISLQAGNNISLKSGAEIRLSSTGLNQISGSAVRVTADGKLSISGSIVAIDDVIHLANGMSDAAEAAEDAIGTELPEPISKGSGNGRGTGTAGGGGYRNQSSMGSSGYASQDDALDSGGGMASGTQALDDSVTEGMLKPLLNLIGKGEGAGYDTVYGGSKLSPQKPITSMSLTELLDWQDRSVGAGSISSAAGRYQVIRGTLRAVISSGAVTQNSTYSPITQDTIAIYLLKVRGLNRFLTDAITKETFANNLAKEWASFPVVTGPNIGSSYYAGDAAGNSARVGVQEVIAVLDQLKAAQNTGNTTSNAQ